MGSALRDLHFHGGFSSGKLLDNPLVLQAEKDLDFGLFGDGETATHLLVVNRRTTGQRRVAIKVNALALRDALTAEEWVPVEGQVDVELAAGGFRLLRLYN